MKHDLLKFLLILLFGTACGFVVGYALIGAFIAALSIIAWQMHRFHKLYRWIKNPNNCPMPESTGQLYQLHRELNQRNRANTLRSRQLTRLFSQFRQAVGVLPDSIILIDEIGQIRWANNNAEKSFGIRWPADANLRFANLVRDPRLDTLLEEKLAPAPNLSEHSPIRADLPPTGVEIKSISDPEQVLNVKVIPYTEDLRMVLARDVTRLVKINQMHSDFVANVSHELKTPLTVLSGYLELLDNNRNLPAAVTGPIEQMARQCKRMQMIVQDLLFLAKLENKGQESATKPIDVTHIINTIMETIQPKVAKKSQKLQLDIDYQLQILGNASELHSAFANLIENAINYTPEQGVVRVQWQSDDSGATFKVSDNGPGIEAHHIPRLTQRFYRIDADRSRDGGGTGLGLAIVKHVLQRHDANLKIDSVEGEGSTFSCRFPSVRVRKVAPDSAQQVI